MATEILWFLIFLNYRLTRHCHCDEVHETFSPIFAFQHVMFLPAKLFEPLANVTLPSYSSARAAHCVNEEVE